MPPYHGYKILMDIFPKKSLPIAYVSPLVTHMIALPHLWPRMDMMIL